MAKPTPKITPLGLQSVSQRPNQYYTTQSAYPPAPPAYPQAGYPSEPVRRHEDAYVWSQQKGWGQSLGGQGDLYRGEQRGDQRDTSNSDWERRPDGRQTDFRDTQLRRDDGYAAIPRAVPVRTGLVNPGNCCFLNSVLQCVVRCGQFADSFSARLDLNPASKYRGYLVTEFARLVQSMRSSSRPADTTPLRRVIHSSAPVFNGATQQDAHEFLRFLLSALSEEVNRVKTQLKPSGIGTKRTQGETADAWWEHFNSRENSLVTDYFRGQLMTTARCSSCGNEVLACDTFLDLSLPIYAAQQINQCLDLFTMKTEAEDFTCESCRRTSRSTVHTQIWRLPPLLVLHLKRFSSSSGFTRKIDTEIAYPAMLMMATVSSSASYELRGVVHHSGDAAYGHYTA